jgi:hypothetical protein
MRNKQNYSGHFIPYPRRQIHEYEALHWANIFFPRILTFEDF